MGVQFGQAQEEAISQDQQCYVQGEPVVRLHRRCLEGRGRLHRRMTAHVGDGEAIHFAWEHKVAVPMSKIDHLGAKRERGH